MTTPMAGPWLSPQVVIENAFPKVLPIMVSRYAICIYKRILTNWTELKK